jgi:drug/metabolite transporter (DMT)-like permease
VSEGGRGQAGYPIEARPAGIALMCAGVVCFALCDAGAKWLNQTLDPMMTAWARYAFNVLVVSAFLNPITTPGIARSNRLGLQILRSAILVGCTAMNFFALQYLQLTTAMAIQFAMPLIVALIAGPLLGEWAGPRRLVAIGIGFVGVLVVTRPFSGGLHPAAMLTVGATVLYAFYAIVTRTLAAHDRTATTVFYSGLVGVTILTPVLPFVWSHPPSLFHWGIMAGIGISAGAGHWLLILAHARAPAPVLSPFIYTQLLWMGILGYLVFNDVPDGWTLVGAAIVVGSGLYLLWWERQARRQDNAPA